MGVWINRRKWARARKAALDRDGWRCVKCGRAGRMDVDHIRPLRLGGAPFAPQNLQTLCRGGCHRDKTAAENGYRVVDHTDIDDWQAYVDKQRDGYDKLT